MDEMAILLRYFGSEKDEYIIRELVRKELEMYFDGDALPEDAQDVLKASFLSIANKTYLKNSDQGSVIRFNRRGTILKFVACASIVLLIGIFYFGKKYTHAPTVAHLPAVVHYKQITTRKGERAQLKLTDGTKIWLAPGSVLNYPEAFKGKTREVSLNGEAFFEVAHDTQHPFIIHTGKLQTTVLGTVFNIRAYVEHAAIEVALLSGKVGVSVPGKQTLVLMPNQRAILGKTTDSLYRDYLGGQDLYARREGRFIYRGTALGEVLNDISELYDITILANKEIRNLRYYGKFDQKENLKSVLMQITLPTGLKIKNDGNTWKLYK